MIKPDVFICPDCGAEVEVGSRGCPKCGLEDGEAEEIDPSVYDGLDLPDEAGEESFPRQPGGVLRHPAMMIVAVVLLILGTVAFLAL